MEVKQITTKSMPYDAWKDNEYIEKLVQELRDTADLCHLSNLSVRNVERCLGKSCPKSVS